MASFMNAAEEGTREVFFRYPGRHPDVGGVKGCRKRMCRDIETAAIEIVPHRGQHHFPERQLPFGSILLTQEMLVRFHGRA